ncbi:hypothetical protein HYPSUDRAFT_33725 [Hypholoma sublateritium FD-334 SS-4]|uniref:Uncharacterized protein n=1 Tax=Hypholoma sublateritium (strain FD-334 SS-4) TaxID=945553 RepID=A0A0D2PIS1_HYPSF|nr:hypothetical protein HYPSUDRAFT_33725 [Hypholoma sublateritium FD-334 SS-4]
MEILGRSLNAERILGDTVFRTKELPYVRAYDTTSDVNEVKSLLLACIWFVLAPGGTASFGIPVGTSFKQLA